MRVLLLSLLVLFSSLAFAQSCPEGQIYHSCDGPQFGPGPCIPGCVGSPNEATGPAELCLPEGCQSVTYTGFGTLVVADSRLPNGYPVMGWSGPCLEPTQADCPDIFNQAFADLELNAKRANRAQRAE